MKTTGQIIDAVISLTKESNPQPAREVIEEFRDNIQVGNAPAKVLLAALDLIGKRDQFKDMESLREWLTEAAKKPDQNFVLALHRAALRYADVPN